MRWYRFCKDDMQGVRLAGESTRKLERRVGHGPAQYHARLSCSASKTVSCDTKGKFQRPPTWARPLPTFYLQLPSDLRKLYMCFQLSNKVSINYLLVLWFTYPTIFPGISNSGILITLHTPELRAGFSNKRYFGIILFVNVNSFDCKLSAAPTLWLYTIELKFTKVVTTLAII